MEKPSGALEHSCVKHEAACPGFCSETSVSPDPAQGPDLHLPASV